MSLSFMQHKAHLQMQSYVHHCTTTLFYNAEPKVLAAPYAILALYKLDDLLHDFQ